MTVSALVPGYPSRDSCPNGLRCPRALVTAIPRGLHGLENSHAMREEGTLMVLPVDVPGGVGPRMSARVLARMATTGIYLVRGVPRGLQRAARARARREGTTLRWILLQALREYAAGTWTHTPGTQCPSHP